MTTVLFDPSFGTALPRTLRGLGVEAEAHADHFAPGTADDVWLAAAAQRGWIVLTGDRRAREAPAVRAALRAHGLACFVLPAGGRTRLEQSAVLSRAWPRILEAAEQMPRPFVCALRSDGSFESGPRERAPRQPSVRQPRPRRTRLQPMLPGMDPLA
jgi:hypothetical protein